MTKFLIVKQPQAYFKSSPRTIKMPPPDTLAGHLLALLLVDIEVTVDGFRCENPGANFSCLVYILCGLGWPVELHTRETASGYLHIYYRLNKEVTDYLFGADYDC